MVEKICGKGEFLAWCVQVRMTSTFCSRSVTESQEVMFSSALVRLFVC